jgi:2-polyprenyl-3-methyl-5-hydroxy-6-metoxy-1,4-benzoquinol methylase
MQCRICGSEGSHRTYVVKEMMMGQLEEHQYFQCSQCQCLQITTIPDNLGDHYPSNYYSYVAPNSKGGTKQSLIRLRDQYAATGKNVVGKALQLLSPNAKLTTLRPLNLTENSRILDVGCGAGLLLHSLREIGFNHLLGLDPFNQDLIEYSNGLRIEKRDIFSEKGQWDVIMFHHSFEHMPEQQATLNKVFELLAPNGTALVRVPTVSSYAWQHYGVNWVQLDAPRHLFLHSVDSIKVLAEQCGFKMDKAVYDSNAFQFWGSEQYEKGIMLRDKNSWAENPEGSLFSSAQIKEFEKRAQELNSLNQGDQAAFYLRKPS